MKPSFLYKIISTNDWQQSLNNSALVVTAADDDAIYLSKDNQIVDVIRQFWARVPSYILLKIDPSKLIQRVRIEADPKTNVNDYYSYKVHMPLTAVVENYSIDNVQNCPCHSGETYGQCCAVFHHGIKAPSALAMMRSRYCAYARGLADYIIKTTHPDSPHYSTNYSAWHAQILIFCEQTHFENLTILNCVEESKKARVTFLATLKQGSQDVSFKEESLFNKVNNHWLYKKGSIFPTH